MSVELANIDTSLIDMRRLWAPTTSGRVAHGADAGIDMSTVLVVTAIGGTPDGLSVAGVADELGVAPATASRLCDRAVTGGYVSKSPSHADPRRLSLTLTNEGSALRSRSEQFRLAYLDRILDGWSSTDIATFDQLLSRFATTVHAHPPTPPSGNVS